MTIVSNGLTPQNQIFAQLEGGSILNAAYLTPDALMNYVATRLQGIDAQVNTAFKQQQTNNASSEALTALQTALGKYTNSSSIGAGDTATQTEISTAFQTAYDAAAGDTGTQQAIAAQYGKFLSSARLPADPAHGVRNVPAPAPGDDDGSVDGTKEIQPMCDALKNAQTDLNSSSELSMINLQSLMSQRQTAVQTVTSMVATLGDTTKAISEKIGT